MSKRPSPHQSPVIFITGCSSGLGYALAKELYRLHRYRVVATVRDPKSLERLRAEMKEDDTFQFELLDVTDQKQREAVIAKTFQRWKAIDVLINNAGVSYRSVIEHMDDESEQRQLDVNYLAPMALIRLVIPTMREKGSGKIINVSSVSGMVSMPTMASYSASKHALEGATEALWYELRPFGISVSLLQPGFIRSRSFEKVYFSKKAALSKDLEGPYSEYYTHMGSFVEKLMLRSLATPEKITRRIIREIENPNSSLWIPATADAIVFYWLRKLLPRTLFHKFMYSRLPSIQNWGAKQRDKVYFLRAAR